MPPALVPLPGQWLVALLIHLPLPLLARPIPLLTAAGWRHAALLGALLWGSLGWRGWLAVVIYLILGSLVTRLGLRQKQAQGLAEARGGRRGPENVWGSALVGAVLAVVTPLAPQHGQPLLLLAFAASFAAKLADTFGSEIGKRWGRHARLISTGRRVPPGTEGAISLEGTAASLGGSALMTLTMAVLGLISGMGAITLVVAVGLLATLLESLIGATLQQRWPWLSNEVVNGLQTLAAAGLALLLAPLAVG
ncbi:MAG: TIGR00297 family protein [Cyanobium sp.]